MAFFIKLMLTEFETPAKDIADLDGNYKEEEMQLDFLRPTKTMEEKEWNQYVDDHHDEYCNKPKRSLQNFQI